jgi:hypothetical protein
MYEVKGGKIIQGFDLHDMYNRSIQMGVFPAQSKIALASQYFEKVYNQDQLGLIDELFVVKILSLQKGSGKKE